MQWIYLSPHPDDAALSCGGLIWEQTQGGTAVNVWTICAGDPPPGPLSPLAQSLQARWQTMRCTQRRLQASQLRRQEDLVSCQVLGARPLHFDLPDCIYRRDAPGGSFLYTSEESLNETLHPAEQPLVAALSRRLAEQLPTSAALICPLAIGGHVDHRLVRQAAELLDLPLCYYADFPYVINQPDELASMLPPDWTAATYPITPAGMQAWNDSIAAHASQISTFWSSSEEMRLALHSYCQQQGGIMLYQPPRFE
jgi:LmbE family N-acetylglucosaminyl deacetylase